MVNVWVVNVLQSEEAKLRAKIELQLFAGCDRAGQEEGEVEQCGAVDDQFDRFQRGWTVESALDAVQ